MSEFVGPTLFKACTKCVELKPLEEFSPQPRGRYGRRSECKICRAATQASYGKANPEKISATQAAYQKSNPEKRSASFAAYYQANVKKMRARATAYQKANAEKEAVRGATYRRANPGKRAALMASWHQANPGKRAATEALRRARKLRAFTAGACQKAIKEIYKQAGREGLAVDHIYPLRGKTVSGLHTECNLRVIPSSTNNKKHSKLPGFLAHELWDPTGPDVFHEESV